MAKTIPADEKVFMVSKTTNTTYSGSAALKAMNEWYTMDDVTNTVRPYKVYTALLTQSGGDFINNNSTDAPEPFIVGVTYYIDENNDTSADFTNIGAPNNNVGTSFVATGTTPNSWGNGGYVNLRYNTGAPVATVLENTIGNIWFTYVNTGIYSINSNYLFTNNKTYLNNKSIISDDISLNFWSSYNSDIQILIGNTAFESPDNGLITNHPIEIRVYN